MSTQIKYFNQLKCVLIAGFAVLTVGCAVGWTTPTIKRLRNRHSEIPITTDESSWLAGIHELGHIISPIPAGLFLQRYGRKPCLFISNTLAIVGWLLVLSTRSINVLYFVRFLFGLSMGIVFTTVPLYIAEVSSPRVRGAFSTCFQAMLCFGHLIEFSTGPYVSYQNLGWISLCITLLFTIFGPFMVESPYFLIDKNEEKAKIILTWLYKSGNNDIEDMLTTMKTYIQTSKENGGSKLKALLTRKYRTSIFIVSLIAIAQRFTGMSAVVAYATTTFSSTKGGLTADQYTIIFGSIGFIFTFISTALLDNLGRRPLMLISCAGCLIFHLITGVYFETVPKDSMTWLPFSSISLFSVLYSLGIGPLVNTLQGELFPPHLKGLASSITTISHGISSFLVTKVFQVIRDNYGIQWNFFIFAIFCGISLIFAFFMVPETRCKPLEELQKESYD